MSTPFERLDDLQGLEGAKKVLRRLASSDAGVHSVLFYGRSGSGSTTLALALAQAWLCTKPTPEGPCGQCPVCKSHAAGRAVDFQRVEPWGPSSIIRRGAIVEPKAPESDPFPGIPLRTFYRTRPLMAKTKTVLIEHADRMNGDAANALLKLLEEPPQGAKFVLTTSELGRVLPTIRSRCLCVACEMGEWASPSPFADTPGSWQKVQESQDHYDKLEEVLGGWDFSGRSSLGLSRDLRAWAEAFGKKTGLSSRQAHAEAARCLALWLVRKRPERSESIQAAALAYRAIIQNGSASIVMDGLFSTVCSTGEHREGGLP